MGGFPEFCALKRDSAGVGLRDLFDTKILKATS